MESADEEWIQRQVEFAYGRWWPIVRAGGAVELPDLDRCKGKDCLGGYEVCCGKSLRDDRFHYPALCLMRTGRLPPTTLFAVNMFDNAIGAEVDHFALVGTRKAENGAGVLMPLNMYSDAEAFAGYPPDPIPWSEKLPIMMFRGSVTGSDLKTMAGQRWNFVQMWHKKRPDIDVCFARFFEWQWMPEADAFSAPVIPRDDQVQYKFILCLEGNDTSSSLHWALSTGCCPVHVYPFAWTSWRFGQGLEPWVHFVPVARDGTDLGNVMDWCLTHDEECRKIATNGQRYAEKYKDPTLQQKTFERIAHYYPRTLCNA